MLYQPLNMLFLAHNFLLRAQIMKKLHVRLATSLGLLAATLLSAGCSATAPTKMTNVSSVSQPKSIQEIADEAMRTQGKLSPEQINALIRANAKCRPNDPQYNRT
jgi:hypothetical protein